MANNVYDPFDKNQPKTDEHWLGKTAIKVGVLSGALWAGYKMKGPAGGLVDKYIKKRMDKIIGNEQYKMIDSQERALGAEHISPSASVQQPYFGIREDDPVISNNQLPLTEDVDLPNHSTRLDDIERKESSIMRSIDQDIGPQYVGNVNRSIDLANKKLYVSPMFAIRGADKDHLMFQLRKEVLYEYFARNAELQEGDLRLLDTFNDPTADAQKLKELHSYYVSNEISYAELYDRRLSRRTKDFNMVKRAHDANPTSPRMSESIAAKYFSGNENFADDAVSAAVQYAYSGKIGNKYRPKDLPRNQSVSDILKSGTKVTSGSLDKTRKVIDNKKFRLLSQFDYTPLLRKISEKVEALKGDRGKDAKIQNIDLQIISKGSATKPQFFLKLSMQHTNHPNRSDSIMVPLSQHGFLPGSSPGVTEKLDGFYLKPEVALENSKRDLKINIDLENKSQQMLTALDDILDGTMMESQHSIDPAKFMSRARSILRDVEGDAITMEGTRRDIFKMFRLVTKTKKSKYYLDMMSDAVTSSNNIKKLSDAVQKGEGVVNITLDFETISRDLPGPAWMARDNFTQFTKAGIVVNEFDAGGKAIVSNGLTQEIVSDHAYDHMKQYGWKDDTVQWLRRELPESLQGLETNEEVVQAWRKQIQQQASTYQRSRGGIKFKNNNDFAQHVGKQLINVLDDAAKSNKEVFLTTKNGNQFDLHLLEKWAPKEYAYLKKNHAQFIDLQSVAYYQKRGYGGEGSLSLRNIIMRMMGRMDSSTTPLNIDKPGNIRKALEFYNNNGYLLAGSEQLDDWDSSSKMFLSRAHSSPVADALMTQMMLVDEMHKFRSGDKSYEGLSNVKKQILEARKILGIEESLEEFQATERKYTIHGMVTSASGLSQGQIAKHMVSLYSINHMIPFSDNPLGKQWDQLFMGVSVRPSDKFNKSLANKTDLEKASLTRKFFKRPIVAQGEIDATSHLYKADAMTNLMSHKVVSDTVYVLNSWMGKEGYNAFSQKVFDRIEVNLKKNVDLSSVAFNNTPALKNGIMHLERRIMKRARDLAKVEGRGVTSDMYDIAAQQVMASRSAKGRGLFIPKGTEMQLSAGDAGFKTIKSELDGYVVNVLVSTDKADKIRLHAEVMHAATGAQFKDISFMYRNALTKSGGVIDDALSKGISMGGAEHVASADWMEKGYVGSQREAIASKIVNTLMDQIENGDVKERTKARKLLKNFARDIGGELVNGTIQINTHKNRTNFRNIVDAADQTEAQKVLGSVDITFQKLNAYMADAGIIWDEQKAKQWYRSWGDVDAVGDDAVIASGRKRISKWLEDIIRTNNEQLNKQWSEKSNVISSYKKQDISDIKRDMSLALNGYFLPDLEEIQKGNRIPMFWEPVKKHTNISNSSYVPGFRNMSYGTLYGMNNGSMPTVKNLKIRGNLLGFLDRPDNPSVGKNTIDHLQQNIRHKKSSRFYEAAATYRRFKDALIGTTLMSVEDLNLEEMQKLLNNKGATDLSKLAKRSLSNTEIDEATDRLTSLIIDEAGNGEDYQKAIHSVIDDLQRNRLAEALETNDSLATLDAVNEYAKLAKKKGVFAYSSKKGLDDGVFSFHLKDMMKDIGADVKDIDKILYGFKAIFDKDRAGSIVESIDETNKVVKLKKIVMAAEGDKRNIFDILNPRGQDSMVGYYSNTSKSTLNVVKAMSIFESDWKANNGTVNDSMEKSFGELKKAYLRYFMKGFNLDSSSVYAKAFELTPTGIRSRVRGAAIIKERAYDIMKYHGGVKGYSDSFVGNASRADKIINRILGSDSVRDVYISSTIAEEISIATRGTDGEIKDIKLNKHLSSIFGTANAKEIKDIMGGMQPLEGYMTRYPNAQAAMDGVLDMRLNIIPNEVAELLGMSINEIHAHSEMTGLFGGDFDGDHIEFVVKGLKNAEALGKLGAEHRAALSKLMTHNTLVNNSLKGGTLQQKRLVHLDAQDGAIVGGFDERGYSTIVSTRDASTISEIFKNSMGTTADNIKTSLLHNPDVVTKQYIKNQLDKVAAVGASKMQIGLFTNMALRRSRQLMTVGLQDNAIANKLIGNLSTGDAGIAQMFISLAKHDTDITELAMASKAFLNPFTKDEKAHKSLRDLFYKMSPEEDPQAIYQNWIDTVQKASTLTKGNEMLAYRNRALENLDFMRPGTNMMDAVLSTADVDFSSSFRGDPGSGLRKSALQELGDSLKKKFKLGDGASSVFRKSGKFAAIGAAAYMAFNFFRPSQMSNSMNPMDGFTDLGVDIDGSHNAFFSNMDLSSRIPLDMVDASFSKKAFMRKNEISAGQYNKDKSSVINDLLANAFGNKSSYTREVRTRRRTSHSNYTSNIGALGSAQLSRRAELL